MASLTVVIPTLRRPAVLARTLERLERQTGSPEFDVQVVSDAAEDDVDAVREAIGERPFPVAHSIAALPGVSAARNHGWRASRASTILFIGDDMLPRPGLVARHLAGHEANPEREAALLGHVRWAAELKLTPFMRWLEHGFQFDYGSIRGSEAGWWHLYTANASFKRAQLEAVEGFDEQFRFGYEELDLAKRMDAIGLRVVYDAAAQVEHLHPATIDGWRGRMRAVARAEQQFLAKHPDADAYFHEIFIRASRLPPARGRAARLVGVIPRRAPLIGPRVWGSADAYFPQQLAPAFLGAWDEARAESG
jgi:GT2 family glycosyltransferase